MTEQTIAAILNKRPKGSIYTVVVNRPAKIRKGFFCDLRKVSVIQGQICDYVSRTIVKDAIESGRRDEPTTKDYVEDIFYLGNVRFWRGKNQKVYLTLPVTGNRSKVTWYQDGKQVQRSEIEHMLLASELTKKPTKEQVEEKGQAQFICITVENVMEVR